MLWLALDLPRLPLEAVMPRIAPPRAETRPQAVVAVRGPRRWIVDSSDPRIAPGMDWGSAQAMLPELQTQPRNLRVERQMLDTLCTWAWRFGSEVVGEIIESAIDYGRPRHRVAVNIAASLKLFGGLDRLLAGFTTALAETGHGSRWGLAPTLDAAILLARAGVTTPVTEIPQLRNALAPLPLPLLDLPPATHRKLRTLGLRTLGGLLDLPADGLARRYGPSLIEDLERLLGTRADGRPRYRLPPRYSRRFDLGSEVDTTEGLMLPLRRLVQHFVDYLCARGGGVQEFRLTLEHPQRRLTRFDLRLAAATRATSRLLRVIRERLDREVLCGPVRALRLSAHRFADPDSRTQDLFDSHGAQDWISLLEMLTARLGHDAVHALATAEDCRPERAWKRIAPPIDPRAPSAEPKPSRSTSAGKSAAALHPLHPASPTETALAPAQASQMSRTHDLAQESRKPPRRPLWLIESPRELLAAPPLLSAAERIEGGWWDGRDVTRDYYRARLGDTRAWVFQDRETHHWYLHGLWA